MRSSLTKTGIKIESSGYMAMEEGPEFEIDEKEFLMMCVPCSGRNAR